MKPQQLAIEAARAAGSILRDGPLGRRNVRSKGPGVDLVTQYDEACEEAIRAVLERGMPGVAVLGEEGGGGAEDAVRWVVDPLDGTNNFVHGIPWYGVSIALEVSGRIDVGVVFDPIRDCAYAATRGEGAWCEGQRLTVSSETSLSEAMVATGFPTDRRERAKRYTHVLERVLPRVRGLRRMGSAALDLAMVAAGQMDAFWEEDLARWDVAAGVLLVEEAGGRISQVGGGPIDLGAPAPVAGNPALHDELAALLNEVLTDR
jgi:myo-inositol-1(or 4)-monophosphatase